MQKSCKNEGCNRKFEKTSSSDLCNPCNNAYRSAEQQTAKRLENSRRQQIARSDTQATNRNLSFSPTSPPIVSSLGPPPSHQVAPPAYSAAAAPSHNFLNYPHLGASSLVTNTQPLPDIDVNKMLTSYNEVKESNTQPKILTDMFGILIHIASKQKENEGLKSDIKSNTERLERIEAKIGGPEEVSERLSIAIRNLPLPLPGGDDLTCVRNALHEIRAPGVDVYRDVVKAVRKMSGNNPGNLLGTVLVELSSEESRASLMKNKKNLANHTSATLQNLIIKNAKSKDRMFVENCTNSLLRLSLGDGYFIAGNGQIKQKTPNNNQLNRQFPSSQPRQPFPPSSQPRQHYPHNLRPRQQLPPHVQAHQQQGQVQQPQANTQNRPRHAVATSYGQFSQYPTNVAVTYSNVQPRLHVQQPGHHNHQQQATYYPPQSAPYGPVFHLPQQQSQYLIPAQVQNQYDPFAMIAQTPPSTVQPTLGSIPPPQPPSVSDVDPVQGQVAGGYGQERGDYEVQSEQVLQEFDFGNEAVGSTESPSSQ